MTRMLALMKYGGRAASTRQRLLQYLPYLESHGVEVEVLPLLDDRYLARFAQGRKGSVAAVSKAYFERLLQLVTRRDHDLVWVQYELFPYLPAPFEKLLRLAGKPYVLDYDDAIFHMYDRSTHGFVRRLLGPKLVPLLRQATACVCGNTYLLDYAARFCPNSYVVPTVVDTTVYRPAADENPDRPLRVGWIGSPSTWLYVVPLLPTILPMLKSRGLKLRAVGAGPAAQGIDGVDSVEWTEATEVAEVQAMDIGIMPLPDEYWARGKCGYKLIQYMACGVPVLASAVGVNEEIVVEGINGFLPRTDQEWTRWLDQLLGDAELRHRLGEAGRSRVLDRYSLASQQARLLAILKAAAGASPPAIAPGFGSVA